MASVNIPEAERKFEEYRQYLQYEATRLAGYVALFRRLYERRNDPLDEMNLAPAFFSIAIDALLSAIILWTDKLFDERGKRGIFDFLTFVENNITIFSVEELKRRKNYPEGHWMLNRDEINIQKINEDKERIRNLSCLKSFGTRRDKYIAHFDKEYFFDPNRLENEAPLTWGDTKEVIEILSEIINNYSGAFDGNLFSLTPDNINDVDYLLDSLHRHQESKSN